MTPPRPSPSPPPVPPPPTSLHSLLLAGGNGLVGHEALRLAQADPQLTAAHALVRRLPAASADEPRLHWVPVDYGALPALPAADAALCALGTTIRTAGSQAAFRAVDFDAVLAFARAAQSAGVERLAVVSALGADARSAVFYNRVKGEMEAALQALGLRCLVIGRPSLLAGDRRARGQATRLGERLGLALGTALGPLIPTGWRPIDAAVVARALLRSLAEGRPGVQVLDSARLQQLGRS